MELGTRVVVDELLDVFSANEGSINMYYGLIGNGKTYAATSDILELLEQGKVVYANWKINVSDFDDRDSFMRSLFNFLFFRKRYYKIPSNKNLHYFDPESFDSTQELVDWLSKLNDCHIFFDEGQDMFDSYEGTRFSKSKRRLILHTRHYHRTLNIISQRPTAIQVSARGNVNRFYKCVKIASWPWVRFARYEYQEMTGETVNELAEPVSVKRYWASSRVFNAYNTSYLADGIPKSQLVYFEAFDLNFLQRSYNLVRLIFLALRPKKSRSENDAIITKIAEEKDQKTISAIKKEDIVKKFTALPVRSVETPYHFEVVSENSVSLTVNLQPDPQKTTNELLEQKQETLL